MNQKLVYILLSLFGLLAACSDDDDNSSGGNNIPGVVTSSAYETVTLKAADYLNGKGGYQWKVINAPSAIYALAQDTCTEALFVAGVAGSYQLQLSQDTMSCKLEVIIQEPAKKVSPYLSKVYDYLPAIGQFVNELPQYKEGYTQEDMNRECEKYIANTKKGALVHLGGFGGYIVFGFDHTIVNVAGKRDLRILGNAFGAASNPRPDAPFGGSCEPGVIMVAYDRNKNGQPDDDEWYEIAGSSHIAPEKEPWYDLLRTAGKDVRTIRNYEITYYRPESEQPEVDGEATADAFVSIRNYARWKDNQGEEGYKAKNIYHNQSYFPQWVKADRITFKGTRLPENGLDESGQGNYFVLYGFRYGYADSALNTDDESAIDFDWAVDADGKPVHLPGVDFVKVYSGVNQENGWLGECSTEISGAVDLHVEGTDLSTRKND